jgi:myo-inositol-1(or 4)-monophosphatase
MGDRTIAVPATAEQLAEWRARASALAIQGGEVLLRLQAARGSARSKSFRRELVTEADRETERVVVGGLLQQYPDHAVLAEEGVLTVQGQKSSQSDWTWIVDPLDGTTNFVHGLPFFAVAIGLAYRSVPVVGVVHAPVLQQTYSAALGLGATCNGTPLRVSSTSELADALLATGFAYRRDEQGAVDNIERLRRVMPHCRDVRRFGSAELDLCFVARGAYDAYWEFDLAPYDVAAGAIVVREAGGRVTDIDGGDAWLYGGRILASNAILHDDVRRFLP